MQSGRGSLQTGQSSAVSLDIVFSFVDSIITRFKKGKQALLPGAGTMYAAVPCSAFFDETLVPNIHFMVYLSRAKKP
jgi:hypothetical protein